MSIGTRIAARIERMRGDVKIADIRRKVRPAERQEELAERQHQHELRKLDVTFKDDTKDSKRAKRQAEREKNRARRRGNRRAVMTSIGNGIIALFRWLSARWLVLRAWVADRIVVLPVLVAGGSALYGQFGYLHDPITPTFDGDRTGMGWAAPVALAAGLAVEVMAFVLFRARKRGLDAGDDVRVETITGWSIVSGAVWFNWTHVDPLAGFLSAIGPIAWEVRERRERRNREIARGTRGIAPIALPRLSIRFRWHYRQQHAAMMRTALWERARLSYPNLVADIENQASASELTARITELANLVAANPVRALDELIIEPGPAKDSSHGVLAIEPGSAEPGPVTVAATGTEPGSTLEPGSVPAGSTSTAEPGSTEPGSRTGFADHTSIRQHQVHVVATQGTTPGSELSVSNPVWTASQVVARFAATEPGCEPGSVTATPEPGSPEPALGDTRSTSAEPGSSAATAEPGSAPVATTIEPGSVAATTATSPTEPGSRATAEPGSAEPGSAPKDALTSNPVCNDESALEQTRPMPRLVPASAEPGSPNPVRHLDELRAEDTRKVRACVELSIKLLDTEQRWVGREEQLKYLREVHNIRGLNNRVRTAWWAEVQQYRELVKAPKTG